MDGEAFFDDLYSQYLVHFPCFAVVLADGQGFATEPAGDGTESLILLTDADLAERYLAGSRSREFTATLGSPDLLTKLLHRLPPSITHVTFDPDPRFHRRYPIDVIRDSLTRPMKKAG
ncbi:MAG: hypothetical protein JWO38_8067 [Gemmataceae bacterium]|nr:hypothetical protein [Gemmataceae bacterium]